MQEVDKSSSEKLQTVGDIFDIVGTSKQVNDVIVTVMGACRLVQGPNQVTGYVVAHIQHANGGVAVEQYDLTTFREWFMRYWEGDVNEGVKGSE